jgi:hypothetical protein
MGRGCSLVRGVMGAALRPGPWETVGDRVTEEHRIQLVVRAAADKAPVGGMGLEDPEADTGSADPGAGSPGVIGRAGEDIGLDSCCYNVSRNYSTCG